jgi:hypothetical protein
MKLPKFKPSAVFVEDIRLPCLVAKVPNSKLPGVGARHIAEFKEDPKCGIYRITDTPGVGDADRWSGLAGRQITPVV